MSWWDWFWPSRKAKVSDIATKAESLAWLKEARDIHQFYIGYEQDDAKQGDDAWHQLWVERYQKIINLIER